MSDKTNLESALKSFDWYYEFSDDGGVWRAGNRRQREIQTMIDNTDPKIAKPLVKKYMDQNKNGGRFYVKENRMLELNSGKQHIRM